jgi:hypothetical protein
VKHAIAAAIIVVVWFFILWCATAHAQGHALMGGPRPTIDHPYKAPVPVKPMVAFMAKPEPMPMADAIQTPMPGPQVAQAVPQAFEDRASLWSTDEFFDIAFIILLCLGLGTGAIYLLRKV